MPAEGGVGHQGQPGHDHGGFYGEARGSSREQDESSEDAPQDNPAGQVAPRTELDPACKGGTPAGADFAYCGPLTEICLLGNIAKRIDGLIVWDAENLKISNLPDANR